MSYRPNSLYYPYTSGVWVANGMGDHSFGSLVAVLYSVATAIAGVFANFTNKMGKITDKLEDVDKAKSRGVSCQH